MMINEQLVLPEPPYLIVVEAEVSKITDFGWSLDRQYPCRAVVRFLRGKKMMQLASLFNEFTAALQFPYYFGENWNAFDECITDLDWIPGDFYVLIITEAHLLLAEESKDQLQALTSILDEAGNEWGLSTKDSEPLGRSAKAFHVIFQSSESEKPLLLSRLKSVEANFQEITL
jgi:hypothetical protein